MQKHKNLFSSKYAVNFNGHLIKPGVTNFKMHRTTDNLKNFGIAVCPRCKFAQTLEPQFCERCSFEMQKPFNQSTK